MRIVTLEHAPTGWRVGYRWADDPLSAPRLLVHDADVPLPRLRQMLERDIFGQPMQPGAYQIIALAERDSEVDEVRAAFPELEVLSVGRDEKTLAVLGSWHEPQAQVDLALALTYWQAIPPDFGVLFEQLDSAFVAPFAEFAVAPARLRADFATIRTSISTALIGQSGRAMRDVCTRLIASPFHLPLTPARAVIGTSAFCGLPLKIIDLRTPQANAALLGTPLLIAAVASDPGPGATELSALQGAERAIIALVNTHTETEDYTAMRDYVRANIGNAIQVIGIKTIEATGRAILGEIVHKRLFGWIEAHFSTVAVPDHVRESIRRVQWWIERCTNS